MASRLENAARNAVGGGSLMDGREPIKTADIIAKYPDGICITGIAKNTYNGSTYPVFTFAEDPSKYFSGATALSKLVDGMLEDYDGDLTEINSDLQKSHLKIKLVKTKTKRGFNFTNVIVVGTVPATYSDENGNTVDAETGEVTFVSKPRENPAENVFEEDGVPF